MARMKKVVITAFGDESKLAIVESELSDPPPGEVQLSVEYTLVSGSDVNMRRGTYPFQKKPPLTPGYSVVGKVRLNGQGCSKFPRSAIASHVFRSTKARRNSSTFPNDFWCACHRKWTERPLSR